MKYITVYMHYIRLVINKALILRSKSDVTETMEKFQITIRTNHDFSILIIWEFIFLANPYVAFIIVASKLLI